MIYAVLIPADVAIGLGPPHPRGGITLRATTALPKTPAVEDLTDVFRAAATPTCPDRGADANTSTGETLLEIVPAHQRIWHEPAGM